VLCEKWRLDRVIGVGGMATVYAATHRTGSRAAIKMLHPSHAWDAEIKRRFLREGYVANTVAHPGAVRVIDDDATEDGAVFIVMDLLEGETLEARRKRMGGKLPPEDALSLVDQLLDILVAAHAKEIVHRDIKPENVFVTHEGTVKLLDFGVARLRNVNSGSVTTLLGTMFGTPAFMSPEQALGRTEQIDAQSDVWGVGAVMFSLISGRLVHVTQTLTEQLVAHASKPAPSLADVAPQTPPPIVAIVDRALAFEKDKRWSDARAMHQAIREAAIALGWPVPASSRSLASLPPPSSAIGRSGVGFSSNSVGGVLSADEAALFRRTGLRDRRVLGALAFTLVVVVCLLMLSRDGDPVAHDVALGADSSATAHPGTAAGGTSTVPVDPAPVTSAAAPPSSDHPPDVPPDSVPGKKSKLPMKSSSKLRPTPSSTGKPAVTPPGDWLDRQH
jgi:serine/threonine-protein kinase